MTARRVSGIASASGPQSRAGPRVFVRTASPYRRLAPPLRRAALATLARVAPHVRGDLTIVLAGDGFIRKLNRRYRRQDRATDVLSFEIGAGCAAGEPFGDVVISVETARRQAKQYDADVRTEMLRLLVHGTLHLCGYDHKGRTEAARMGALTSRLLQTLQSHV